jgi:hypothetical protein
MPAEGSSSSHCFQAVESCVCLQILGMSKKGKEFFKFNTQVTEAITKVDVCDLNIWSSAEYVHNWYIEGKDKAFYLCLDRINHAEVWWEEQGRGGRSGFRVAGCRVFAQRCVKAEEHIQVQSISISAQTHTHTRTHITQTRR